MTVQEAFINFISEQGFLPTQIVRAIRSGSEHLSDINTIADLLNTREKFDISKHDLTEYEANLIQTTLQNKPFASDKELSEWLRNASGILINLTNKEILPGIPVPQEYTECMVKSFIQNCPLVSDQIKQHYLNINQTNTKTYIKPQSSFDSYGNKITDKFVLFLKENGKKLSTAYSYVSALNKVNAILCELNIDTNIWKITDQEEIFKIIKVLQKSDIFNEKNSRAHNALSSAIKCYLLFVHNQQ